jgi:hypothetical protein
MKNQVVRGLMIASMATGAFGCSAELDGAENLGTTAEAVTIAPADINGYDWKYSVDGLAAQYMTSTAGTLCVLTGIQGRFTSPQDSIYIEGVSPGVWVLRGTRGTGDPGAYSYCYSAGQITPEVTWQRGQSPVVLATSVGWSCFLTRIQGRLENGYVRITKDAANRWTLDGFSPNAGDGLRAGARCLNRSSQPEEYLWDNTKTGSTRLIVDDDGWQWRLDSQTSGPACGLTRVAGDFLTTTSTDTNKIQITLGTNGPHYWSWYLGGHRRTTRSARARCFF